MSEAVRHKGPLKGSHVQKSSSEHPAPLRLSNKHSSQGVTSNKAGYAHLARRTPHEHTEGDACCGCEHPTRRQWGPCAMRARGTVPRRRTAHGACVHATRVVCWTCSAVVVAGSKRGQPLFNAAAITSPRATPSTQAALAGRLQRRRRTRACVTFRAQRRG
eukprot:364918-Chlamydomonas_euryale.AAC.12